MSPCRAVLLLRRFSSGDTRLKNITVNQNREANLCVFGGNIRDLSQFHRVSSSQKLCCHRFQVRLNDNLVRMASTKTPQNDKPKYTNSLIHSKSPYLLQHAHNPVNWYPWGEEAFEKARRENKLIFLSVGYSTCHWCHVMEKESFEDEETARIMNQHYINVKVDREERPDIDEIYMLFITSSTGRGGWPMSVFLTPQLLPVAGGTYFPPEDRWGTPSFKRVILSFAKKWEENRDDFIQSGKTIITALKNSSRLSKEEGANAAPGSDCWEKGVRQFMRTYESEFGGFGMAPKFPQPSNFNFLFHFYARNKNDDVAKKCLEMCLHTLTKMANGGIHDHVSNGFARYSVDGKWHVPHFEKMLYDQAQLTMAYTDAYLATKNEFYSNIVRDIITYVNRDLSHELGGFYSAEDADSYPNSKSKEKKEGAFCVWEFEEIEALLEGKTINSIKYSDIFCHHFNVKPEGNCEHGSDPHGELRMKNVLIVFGSVEETAKQFGLQVSEANKVLDECKQILHEERRKRPRPHLDTKILCSWNGLMISGLSQAGQGLGEKSYVERAIKAAHFVRKYLYIEDKHLLLRSCYRAEDGSISQPDEPILGFLNDYAFLIRGLVDLYEASLDLSWLAWAQQLQRKQDELFWDADDGGYFTSAANDETVVLRLKEDQDGAEPCGNSVACHNLLRLAAYSDKTPGETNAHQQQDEVAKAEGILTAFSARLREMPMALPEMLSALLFYQDSPMQVLIAGGCEDPRTLELVRVVRSRLLPARVLAVADPNVASEIAVLSRIRPVGDRPTAYVCRRFACSLPVTDVHQLEKLLDESTLEDSKQKCKDAEKRQRATPVK